MDYSDLIGKPFKDGGRGPFEYDCWGLAAEGFRRCGILLPDYQISCDASDQVNMEINANRKKWVPCTGEIPVPALVVFADRGVCTHVGVYIGQGKFLHAYEKTGVAVGRTNHPFWKNRIEGFYRPGWLDDISNTDPKSDTT
ncbi:MAG: NlpC/P60 family protein [Sporomusaceae bacterium]|nr:NlpC/P60 family protein [Sporomusaceae bacterium]